MKPKRSGLSALFKDLAKGLPIEDTAPRLSVTADAASKPQKSTKPRPVKLSPERPVSAAAGDATIAGIDPGLNGAVVIIGKEIRLFKTPLVKLGKRPTYDLPRMRELLTSGIDFVVIEDVHAHPKQGTVSMFNFGVGYGLWKGLLSGLQIPYQVVAPQEWQREVLRGTARDKQAAIEFCHRRFPRVSLLATERSRVPDDGLADALCIAEYGRRIYSGT